jgi:transposase
MDRHILTDAQWEQIRSLLPPQKPATGRPAKDHRTIVEGILWQLTSGTPWRALPTRYGSWQTVYSRYRRWQLSGVWACVRTSLGAHDETDWARVLRERAAVRSPSQAPDARDGVEGPATIGPSSTPSRPASGSGGMANRWSTW